MKKEKPNCHAPKMRQTGQTEDTRSATDGFVLGARLSENPRKKSSSRYQIAVMTCIATIYGYYILILATGNEYDIIAKSGW